MKKQRKRNEDLVPDEQTLEEKYGWIEDDLEEAEIEEEKKSKMIVHGDQIKDVFRQKEKRNLK